MERKREESGDLLTESEVLQKHALLHALLERKTMTLNQCKELTKKLTGDEENFFKLIGEINRDLKLMKMKVKMGEDAVALCNQDTTETKDCSKFSYDQMKYFQTVVFGIEGIPEKRLSTMQLLNLEQQRDREQDQEQGGSQQPSQELSKREKEELLKVFVKDGWLSVSNNFYSVGPRTSLELKSLIESQINVNAA